jgi:hypothetical protein
MDEKSKMSGDQRSLDASSELIPISAIPHSPIEFELLGAVEEIGQDCRTEAWEYLVRSLVGQEGE